MLDPLLSLDPTTLALDLLLGMLLGAVGGMLGIGGGLIAIPLLAWLYDMNQTLAQGTALVMIVPNVLIGFLRYRQRHPFDLRQIGSMLLPAIVTSHLSARLAVSLAPDLLRHAFAGFLVFLTALLLWQLRVARSDAAQAPLSPRLLPLVGLASGFMSGLFTIGGGMVVVPALVLLFGVAQTTAQGMALAMVLPGAIIALGSYAHAGQVVWQIGLPLALGGVLTVSLGVRLAYRLAPAVLRAMFCLVLLGTAAAMAR